MFRFAQHDSAIYEMTQMRCCDMYFIFCRVVFLQNRLVDF